MVSWKDYEGVDGFGATSQQEVDELNKALAAGNAQNPPGSAVAGDGFALRVESLESTLKNTTYKMEHIQLWKAIRKIPAYNTVEEHNEIQSYGENSDAGWISEGDLPEEDDARYERKFSVVKFLGTSRRVTHPMTLVRPAPTGNVIAQETVNGTMHLLRIMESALFYGDATLSALQFDGYETLIKAKSPTTNIIDCRGKPLSEDYLTDGALTAHDAPNYGKPTHLFCNPKIKADLVKTFFPKERHDTFTANGNLVGLDIKGFTSPAGDIALVPDVFISDGGAPNAAAVGDSTKRPGTPTITTPDSTPGSALSKFTADDAGDYFYKIVACNRYGRSIPVVVDASAITVAAGDETTFGVTPGGTTTTDWWEVYRSAKGGATTATRRIIRVVNAAGVGETIIHDYNNYLPFCSSAFMFQLNEESMTFKQLAPMIKIPLATIDSSIRWMQLIYGVPVLYTPGKNVLYLNVGRSSGYVGAA